MVLALDASTPAVAFISAGNTSVTSATFSPPAASVLFAVVPARLTSTTSPQVTGVTNTGTALTWARLVGDDQGASGVEVWWAYNTASQANITVTATLASAAGGGGTTQGLLRVLVFTGAATTQNGATAVRGVSTAGTPSVSVTSTANNSWVWGAVINTTSATAGTAASGQTVFGLATNGAGLLAVWVQQQNATTLTSGTVVAINDTAPTGISYLMAVFEVLPASTAITGTASIALGLSTVAGSGTATTVITGTVTVGLGPLVMSSSSGVVSGCARVAWLVLDGDTLLLEDVRKGYFCTQLDLGSAELREVVTNRPDQDGQDDRTMLMGGRIVSANITALTGAGARIDDVASSFAPFMAWSARPVLHYVLDRPGHPERTLSLRGQSYTWPISGGVQRDVHLQWLAADPIARDPNVRSIVATTSAPATFSSSGDVAVCPLFRITGPITAAVITLTPSSGPVWKLAFVSTFTVAAGHFIDIDTQARTIYLDGNAAVPRLSSLDWTVSSWQWLAAATSVVMALAGTSTSGATQVAASWQDGYLT